MKIARIGTIYTLYGRRAGAELYFEKVISGLANASDGSIHYVVYCNKSAAVELGKMTLPNCSIYHVPLLDNQYSKLLWLLRTSRKRILEDGIGCFWIPSGTNHFPGRWSVPSVVTFHDFGEYHVPGKYDFKRMLYRKHICIKLSIRRGTTFTSVSEFTARDLMQYWKKKSVVIYSGPSPQNSDYGWESRGEAVAAILEECGVDLSSPFFFTPGRTDYVGKGLDTLFDAIEAMSTAARSNCRFVLCGPKGEDHEAAEQRIQRIGGTAVYLGRVSERAISALYKACTSVIFPSRFEGFGFPVLEAFQNRKPIILSNGGALPEVAGNAGIYFSVGDSAQLRTQIEAVLSSPKDFEEFVNLGAIRLQDFSWEQTMHQMGSVFQSALNAEHH